MNTADTAAKREMLQELLMEKHRRAFPSLANTCYFNYGAQGLLSEACTTAIADYYRKLSTDVPYTMDNTLSFLEILKQARGHLAAELGVTSAHISLVESTSVGCNIALWGLAWQEGDHVIITDCEYPGVLIAVQELARRHRLQIDTWSVAGTDEALLEDLARQLKPRTRLVVCSHIPWTTGRVLPLKQICERVHQLLPAARVLVDGAQSVGVLPLDLSQDQVDYYAFTAHKWLCGPEGTGGLYVRPEAAADLHPTFLGPRSIDLDADRLRTWQDGRRFEISTQPIALYAGMNAALLLHRRAGTTADRFQRLNKMALKLYLGLRALQDRGLPIQCLQDTPPQAGLVYFRVANNRHLVLSLEDKHMNIRTIPARDCVRVSIHYLTLQKEVQQLLEGIESYCATRNSA